jgi:GDP/UDP-N,N'-diacetylbacillosamine 2-epimerase (hydrolysing)
LIRVYSTEFLETLKTSINPYGNGHTSQKIINKIKKVNLKTI